MLGWLGGGDRLAAQARQDRALELVHRVAQALKLIGDPLVLVDDPILGDAIAEIASGRAGADLPEEKALIVALNEAKPRASAAIDAEDFTAAMAALASLRQPIDIFFDKVTVNDADPSKRERRLNLLARFRDAVNGVADFSKIEG